MSIATLFAIFGTLAANSLSNFFPPGGLSVAQIANTILKGVLITPANYAFSIWGLIYTGLIAYGINQFLSARRGNLTLQRVNLLLIAACVAQIAWIYLFTLRLFALSIIAMLAILFPLIRAYLLLRIGRVRVERSQKWLVHIPFSIYLAWISVATIVNVASALYIAQWQGWGISAESWTVIMSIVATAIGAIVALQRSDTAFVMVYIWALVAIAIRQSNVLLIAITAVAGAITIAALLGYCQTRRTSQST